MATEAEPVGRALRIVAADEDRAALERTVAVIERLGHRVTGLAVDVAGASEQVLAEDPDLAIVVVHRDPEHALDLVGELAACANGPVVLLLDDDDPAMVRRAAERGVWAYARSDSPADMQSAIELAVRRHRESTRLAEQVGQLEGALDRRAVIERAKGIVMERHGVGEREAFELLRSHARTNHRTVVDTARAVCDGHGLLPPR